MIPDSLRNLLDSILAQFRDSTTFRSSTTAEDREDWYRRYRCWESLPREKFNRIVVGTTGKGLFPEQKSAEEALHRDFTDQEEVELSDWLR